MKSVGVFVAVATLGFAAPARADGEVAVTLTPEGEELGTALGVTPDQLAQQLEDTIDEMYRVQRADEFLRAFADATSFSNRGIGVDYASNADGLMFGLAANLAVAVGDLGVEERDAEHPVAGVAANLAIMGGVNLERFDQPRLTLYGNGFWRRGAYEQLDGSITSVGVHAQYQVLGETRGNKALVFQWSGLTLTGGLELARWAFGLEDSIDTDYTIDGDTDADATLSSTGRFDLTSTTVTVPLEATTGVRILYLLSVYGGVGIDLQAGTSTLDADLDGTMTAIDPRDDSEVDLGTADITIDGSSSPSVGKLRGLLGVQVNFWKLKVFVQANAMPFRAASVAAGLRVVL